VGGANVPNVGAVLVPNVGAALNANVLRGALFHPKLVNPVPPNVGLAGLAPNGKEEVGGVTPNVCENPEVNGCGGFNEKDGEVVGTVGGPSENEGLEVVVGVNENERLLYGDMAISDDAVEVLNEKEEVVGEVVEAKENEVLDDGEGEGGADSESEANTKAVDSVSI